MSKLNDLNREFFSSPNEIKLSFSLEEAKIIFDALSSHRFKIAKKKESLSEFSDEGKIIDEKIIFLAQRLKAIESEIAKTDTIFQKIGEYVKEKDGVNG